MLGLQESTWRLISVWTFARVSARKWVAPIQAFRSYAGCETEAPLKNLQVPDISGTGTLGATDNFQATT